MLEHAIENGRGGCYLRLTPELSGNGDEQDVLGAIAIERLRCKPKLFIHNASLLIAKLDVQGEAALATRAKHVPCPHVCGAPF
jgi:hypothetical protein